MRTKSCPTRTPFVCTVFLAIFLMTSTAQAHFPWINLADYTPNQGATVNLTIGNGHQYPFDGFLKMDALESITLIGPGAKAPAVKAVSDLELQTEEGLSQEGAYIVAAVQKPGYYTKTTQGTKRTSKKGLSGVISSSHSQKCMKAVLNLGKGGRVDKVLGHAIEIVPLENPGNLKIGDYLPIRVLAEGKPISTDVLATYAGFSTDKSTFAYATRTDREGQGRIRILHPGIWLIKVSHERPCTDLSECDMEKFTTSLTFAVD